MRPHLYAEGSGPQDTGKIVRLGIHQRETHVGRRVFAGRSLLVTVLLGAAVFASGCGSSSNKAAPSSPASRALESSTSTSSSVTPGAEQNRLRASVAVESAGRLSNGAIISKYTCKGANTSLPITWAGVHGSAKEVTVVVRTIVGGLLNPGSYSQVDWALANISPSVNHIAAGETPPGAVVGRNRLGKESYSLCPPAGKLALVTIAVDAFPKKLNLANGFEPSELAKAFAQPGVQWGSLLSAVPKHS